MQCLDLSIHPHLCGRQTGNAHLHFDILYATLLFGHSCHLLHLAYGGFGKVVNAELGHKLIDNFSFYGCWFHIVLSVMKSIF